MHKIKALYTLLIPALVTVFLMVMGMGSVNGQTRIYAQYLASDGTAGAGGSLGLLGANGSPGSFNSIGTANIGDTDYSNFATLSAISGTPGTGVLPGAGGISIANVYITLSGSATYTTGTPVIIKLTSTKLANVEVQGYINSTPLGSPQSFPTLSKVTGSSDEYIFNTLATCNKIRISVKTDAGVATASSNSANLYYAFNVIQPTINNVTICSGNPAPFTINSPDPTLQYKWYTAPADGTLVNTGPTYNPTLTATTNYYVEAVDNSLYSSLRVPVTGTVNILPTITASPSATAIPTGTSMTLTATSNASTIKWYDHDGVYLSSGSTLPLGIQTTMGTFTYTAVADNGTCTNSTLVNYSVYSATQCPNLTQRVYANAQTATGNVISSNLAVDGDPKTASSLSPILDLLGLLAPTQSLTWNTTIPAGTPVSIKLGPDADLLSLASGISVVGLKRSGSSYTEIGSPQSINVSLLNLLAGENTFEYTFIPTSGVTAQSYDGVKIVFSSLLAIGKSIKVFEAYYQTPVSSVDCTKKDVVDVLYGAEAPLGIGALTATVNVVNPWNAVDGNDNTFTTLNAGVGVAAYAKEHIIFSSPSLPGDSLKIVASANGTLLTLGLLGGFSIQRYLGNSPVGDPIAGSSSLLDLRLLNGGSNAVIMLLPMAEPYDQIEIRLGGVVSALSTMNINEVYRIANTKVIGSDNNNTIQVCKGTSVLLPAPNNDCISFEWYDVNGVKITSPSPKGLELPTTNLAPGTYTFYVQPVRFGCNKFMARGSVTVTVNPLPTVSAIIGNANICVGVGYTFTNTSADPGVWTSDNTAVATVDNTGFVKGVTPGTANITYTITNATTHCINSTSFTVNVAALPTIALGNIPAICAGSTTASLPYTAVSSGTLKYDIIWNTTSLTNVSGVDLTASPIQLSIPANAPVGTYTGTFIIRNTTSTCTNSYPITITINPLPSITLQPLVPICANRTEFKINYTNPVNSPTSYTIQWDLTATTAGWAGVTSTPLTGGVISITMPNNVPANTYHGTLTINNGTCSNDIPLNIDIYATPHQPNISIAN